MRTGKRTRLTVKAKESVRPPAVGGISDVALVDGRVHRLLLSTPGGGAHSRSVTRRIRMRRAGGPTALSRTAGTIKIKETRGETRAGRATERAPAIVEDDPGEGGALPAAG